MLLTFPKKFDRQHFKLTNCFFFQFTVSCVMLIWQQSESDLTRFDLVCVVIQYQVLKSHLRVDNTCTI